MLGVASAAVLVGSRSAPRVVDTREQRILARRVAAAAIARARDRDGDGDLVLRDPGQDAAATPPGQELLSLLVACALPADVTLVATVSGARVEFFGDLGLAPRWLREPLDRAGRAWVSGCVMAQLSETALAIPVLLRGPRRGLAASPDERDAWSLEEGAFFGDLFADVDAPLPWFACRGVGDAGDPALADRVCTEPDDDRPGQTRCGMVFVGSCQAACASSRRGFYEGCQGAGFKTDRVVTTFLVP